jgi:hypothetical protein
MVDTKGLEKLKHDSVICRFTHFSLINRYSWNRGVIEDSIIEALGNYQFSSLSTQKN